MYILKKYSKNIDNNWFCPEPFMNFETSPDGKWGMCCKTHFDYNTDDVSPLEHFNSDLMKKIRKEMVSGDLGELSKKYCTQCIDAEKSNIVSMRKNRTKMISNFPKHIQEGINSAIEQTIFSDGEIDINDIGIYQIDLKIFGNLCNLKCLMCSPQYSSQIASEMKKENNFDGPTTYSTYNVMDKKKLYSDLDEILPRAMVLKFTGGEPMMIPSILDIIKFTSDKGYSKNLELHLITNGTVINEEIIKYSNNFKSTRIFFSIEGIGKLEEYIRYGTKFEEKIKNIDYLCSNISNLKKYINTTVQSLNVGYIDELIKFSIEKNIKLYHNSVLMYPTHMRIQVLPLKLREYYLKKQDSIFNTEYFRYVNNVKTSLEDTKMFTEKERIIQFNIFKNYILSRDKIRDVSIKNVLPEIYDYF